MLRSISCASERLCQGIGMIKAEELWNINKYDEFAYNIYLVLYSS